jgi:hypothetical protein
MQNRWPQDKLAAVTLPIAAMTPESGTAMIRIRHEVLFPDRTGMADCIRQHLGL